MQATGNVGSTGYDDFFAGFKFGDAAGFFTTFEENLPVCGAFGSPRILIRFRPSPDLRAIMFPNCRRQICLTAVFIHRNVYGLRIMWLSSGVNKAFACVLK